MRIIAAATLVALVQWAAGFAWADEPQSDPSLTQAQLSQITATSGPDGTPTTAVPIHNLSESEASKLKKAGGRLLINGELWKSESPADREKRLNKFKEESMPAPGIVLLIEVPSGNVWVFQAGEENANLNDKIRENLIHPWYPHQVLGLPIAAAGWDRPDRGPHDAFVGRVDFNF